MENKINIPEGIKKCAAICILKNNDKYLLMKRGKRKTNKEDLYGNYLIIGGKLDPFETPEEAAKREVFEETGYTIDNLEFKGMIISSSKGKYNWVHFVYLSKVAYFEPIDTDEGYAEWVYIDDIEKLPTPATDKEIYKYVDINQKFIINNEYDENVNLIYSKEELSGRVIVNRK